MSEKGDQEDQSRKHEKQMEEEREQGGDRRQAPGGAERPVNPNWPRPKIHPRPNCSVDHGIPAPLQGPWGARAKETARAGLPPRAESGPAAPLGQRQGLPPGALRRQRNELQELRREIRQVQRRQEAHQRQQEHQRQIEDRARYLQEQERTLLGEAFGGVWSSLKLFFVAVGVLVGRIIGMVTGEQEDEDLGPTRTRSRRGRHRLTPASSEKTSLASAALGVFLVLLALRTLQGAHAIAFGGETPRGTAKVHEQGKEQDSEFQLGQRRLKEEELTSSHGLGSATAERLKKEPGLLISEMVGGLPRSDREAKEPVELSEEEAAAIAAEPGSEPISPAGLSPRELTFEAYDCSEQAGMEVLTVEDPNTCPDRANLEAAPEMEYKLLQKVKTFSFPIYECFAVRTRIMYECGVYGHAHDLGNNNDYARPYALSVKECQQAVRQGTFFPMNYEHGARPNVRQTEGVSLAMNATTRMHTHSNGWLQYSSSSVACYGEKGYVYIGTHASSSQPHRDDRREISSLVVYETWAISIYQREAFVSLETGQIIVHHNQLALPAGCSLELESCQLEGGYTYFWDAPTEGQMCPYYGLRSVQGISTREPRDLDRPPGPVTQDQVFVSTDESMIRFRLNRGISRCDAIIYPTQYPSLFLTLDVEHPKFQRELHPREFDIFTYIDAQDEFVYQTIKTGLKEMVASYEEQRCRENTETRKLAFAKKAAEQQSIIDGHTAHLGGGQYVTAAGEVFHSYHCRPVVADAVLTADRLCYDALPVQLRAADEQRRAQTLSQEPGEVQLFLEPYTRRLVEAASVIDCEHPQKPIYKNQIGSYLAYKGTHMYLTRNPKVLERSITELSHLDLPDFNFAEGGIYNPQIRQRLNTWQQAPRMMKGVIAFTTLAAQKYGWHGQGRVPPRAFVPSIPRVLPMGFFDLWGRIYRFLHTYGALCSVIVGTGIILQCFAWFIGVLLRLYSTPVTPSLCLHVISAFFPALGDYLMRGSRWHQAGTCGFLCGTCLFCKKEDHHHQYAPAGHENTIRTNLLSEDQPAAPKTEPPRPDNREQARTAHHRAMTTRRTTVEGLELNTLNSTNRP